jgi:SAM-dependent methyltransferase
MPAEAATFPDPGEELIERIAGTPDRNWFYWSGRESIRELERTLAVADRTLDSFTSILDFGCGCGRMLLWLEELSQTARLHGTDIDPEAIAWVKDNLPYVEVSVNDADPPLPYPDKSFDLVYNHSVFTHIDERRQDRWLSELQRVTQPGALILLSVQGEAALPPPPWDIRPQLERNGIVFLDQTVPTEYNLPEWYQSTWHAPWYLFEHWGRFFDIRAFIPRAALGLQDHVLLERRADDAPPPKPLAARPELSAEANGGAPPDPGVQSPADRVAQALRQAGAYRRRPGAGGLRSLAKQAVLRAIRPYTVHEDAFDEAVAKSLAEISRVADRHERMLDALMRRFEGR